MFLLENSFQERPYPHFDKSKKRKKKKNICGSSPSGSVERAGLDFTVLKRRHLKPFKERTPEKPCTPPLPPRVCGLLRLRGFGVRRSAAGTGMFMFAAPANTNIRGAAPRTPGGAAAGPDVRDTKGKEFQMITSIHLAVILFCLIAPSGGRCY